MQAHSLAVNNADTSSKPVQLSSLILTACWYLPGYYTGSGIAIAPPRAGQRVLQA